MEGGQLAMHVLLLTMPYVTGPVQVPGYDDSPHLPGGGEWGYPQGGEVQLDLYTDRITPLSRGSISHSDNHEQLRGAPGPMSERKLLIRYCTDCRSVTTHHPWG